jgi:dihydroneopterin aldolase
MALIKIEGMEFFAYHGCFTEESIIGTRFIVDIELSVDTSQAQSSDNLHHTVNYLSVYQTIKEQMEIRSNLLENVAHRIIDAVKHRFPLVTEANVKVSKLNPPLGGKIDRVSVTINSEDKLKE